MTRYKLEAERLKVESFATITDPTDTRGTTPPDPANCICFAPPCICTNNHDCTSGDPQ